MTLDYTESEKEEAEAMSNITDRDTEPLTQDATLDTGEGHDKKPVGDLPGAIISDADKK